LFGSILLAACAAYLLNRQKDLESIPDQTIDNIKDVQDLSWEERQRGKIVSIIDIPFPQTLISPVSSSQYATSMTNKLNDIPQYRAKLQNGTNVRLSGMRPILGGTIADTY